MYVKGEVFSRVMGPEVPLQRRGWWVEDEEKQERVGVGGPRRQQQVVREQFLYLKALDNGLEDSLLFVPSMQDVYQSL